MRSILYGVTQNTSEDESIMINTHFKSPFFLMQVCTARDDNGDRGDLRGFENAEFLYVHKTNFQSLSNGKV